MALVLVPQSMAYAQLAGLPPYYGLYAAFLPPMVASLFGSSRQLATGPVAVVSLMTAAALEPLATAGSEQYVAYALLLALMVGLFQFALGVLRLGVVVNFLSHPVVNGFTNAAALIIATSQLSKLFGVYVDKAPHHYETIWRVLRAAAHFTHWPTVGMAAIAFVTMLGATAHQQADPRRAGGGGGDDLHRLDLRLRGHRDGQRAPDRLGQRSEVDRELQQADARQGAAGGTPRRSAEAVEQAGRRSPAPASAATGSGQWRTFERSAAASISGAAALLHDKAGLFDARLLEMRAGDARRHEAS